MYIFIYVWNKCKNLCMSLVRPFWFSLSWYIGNKIPLTIEGCDHILTTDIMTVSSLAIVANFWVLVPISILFEQLNIPDTPCMVNSPTFGSFYIYVDVGIPVPWSIWGVRNWISDIAQLWQQMGFRTWNRLKMDFLGTAARNGGFSRNQVGDDQSVSSPWYAVGCPMRGFLVIAGFGPGHWLGHLSVAMKLLYHRSITLITLGIGVDCYLTSYLSGYTRSLETWRQQNEFTDQPPAWPGPDMAHIEESRAIAAVSNAANTSLMAPLRRRDGLGHCGVKLKRLATESWLPFDLFDDDDKSTDKSIELG